MTKHISVLFTLQTILKLHRFGFPFWQAWQSCFRIRLLANEMYEKGFTSDQILWCLKDGVKNATSEERVVEE